jgi:hypothetical protein
MFVQNAGADATGSTVVGAIQNAASATGTNFGYLLATARVESSLNPNASASSSSAKGLYQFIEQTWLTTVKESGPGLGFGRYADAIVRGADGRYAVPDATMKRTVMALRNDPHANALMAGAFTQRNAALLTEKIGRKPSEGELYAAHFLGASGAARLINNAAKNPQAGADALFPRAAAANRPIFYDRQGQARSVSEVYGVLVGRYNVARASQAMPVNTARAVDPAPASRVVAARFPTGTVAPRSGTDAVAARSGYDRAAARFGQDRITATRPVVTPTAVAAAASPAAITPVAQDGPATADNTRPVFNSLFRSDPDRGPVSQTIRELWSSRPHIAAALMGQQLPPAQVSAQAPAAPDAVGAPLDLFPDQATDAKALFGVRS